ncbi:A/G-specific adenine glycosylase [Desulfovibrio mangrovi]|uniref:A/G-specific adenine glycosylase n=1 Tax=Desulfovibrio mangrovi TaxID=2976983 RepID=UPI0022452B7E|nr:A/G-specific adenine glycosylase [Desulfovibrio mangrovi]UZP66875.1 A/G-specific adenine glycosylase [Desulfovibrio mangrovi]
MLHPQDHSAFSSALLDWFDQNKRPLPWRTDYQPYHVWISEIMLQQTQMERGVDYFLRWIEHLPDIASVAAADEDTVLKLWEGLGYYSRVRNLHKAARIIMDRHSGCFPEDIASIRALPGIGDYTAGAIASIAFGQDAVCIDANVERVIARVCDIDSPVKQKENMAFVRKTARSLLPSGQAREFNQAMMELGALVCSKKARCGVCPVSRWCEALHLGIVHERPVPTPKKPITHLDVGTGLLIHNGRIFIQKRPEHGVWAGFWEFPGGCVEQGEQPHETVVREYMEEMEFAVTPVDKITVINHGYTTYRVSLHCYFLKLKAGDGTPVLHAATDHRWVRFDELDRYTLPAGHRKLADFLATDLRLAGLLEE